MCPTLHPYSHRHRIPFTVFCHVPIHRFILPFHRLILCLSSSYSSATASLPQNFVDISSSVSMSTTAEEPDEQPSDVFYIEAILIFPTHLHWVCWKLFARFQLSAALAEKLSPMISSPYSTSHHLPFTRHGPTVCDSGRRRRPRRRPPHHTEGGSPQPATELDRCQVDYKDSICGGGGNVCLK